MGPQKIQRYPKNEEAYGEPTRLTYDVNFHPELWGLLVEETLCCGAGGALWWKKETQGRTHLVRAEQVIESEVDTVVTGCNFCYGMMKQGLGPMTPEGRDEVIVKDVADIVAENLI